MSDADGNGQQGTVKHIQQPAGAKVSHGKPRALHRTFAVAQLNDKSKGDDDGQGGNVEQIQQKAGSNRLHGKPHGLREAIREARKTAAASNVAQKQPASPANLEAALAGNELPAPKRQKKAAPIASNLSKDWKKKGTQPKGVGEKNATQMAQSAPLFRTKNVENASQAEDTTILEESGTKDKASVRSQINAPRTLLLTPKETKKGDREWAEAIEQRVAVKKAMGLSGGRQERGDGNLAISAEPAAQSTKSVSGPFRLDITCSPFVARDILWSQMGLKVFQANVNLTAGTEVAERPKSKALKDIKVTDLPIEDTMLAKRQWDTLICLLIDWAGTTDDPFGTNKNPDLMPTIQELWDGVFGSEEGSLDVTKYPAIKKIACDRLNTWRSDIGKRGITCLEQYFKAPEYIENQEARVTFVMSQVPYICKSDDQPMFPLIYRDYENMKGAWEAPLMMSILSKHIHRVGVDHFMAFGRPSGALALCAASVERALELFQGGENTKNMPESTGDGDNQGRRSGKNQFDYKFSMAAQQYALSAANLGENKWNKIISLAQTSSVAHLAGTDQDASQLNGMTENEEYLTAARALIPVSDSEDEDVASIGENAEDEDRNMGNPIDEEGGIEEASNGEI